MALASERTAEGGPAGPDPAMHTGCLPHLPLSLKVLGPHAVSFLLQIKTEILRSPSAVPPLVPKPMISISCH